MEMARTKLDNDRVTENEKKCRTIDSYICEHVFMKCHPRNLECVYEISFEYAIFAIMTAIANMIAAIEIN